MIRDTTTAIVAKDSLWPMNANATIGGTMEAMIVRALAEE
jgi:hypothetical protein